MQVNLYILYRYQSPLLYNIPYIFDIHVEFPLHTLPSIRAGQHVAQRLGKLHIYCREQSPHIGVVVVDVRRKILADPITGGVEKLDR